MKKIIVITVMMAVLIGAIYPQNLSLGGYFNSGAGVVASDAEDSDAYLKAFGADSEQHGYRFRLNGTYNNEARTTGIRFRLQSQGNLTLSSTGTATAGASPADHTHGVTTSTSSGYLSLPYVYGFVNLLENKLSFTAGIVDDATFRTADWWINDGVGEGLGLLIKSTPVEGFNLGFGSYLISQQSSSRNNILTVGNNANLPNFANIQLNLDEVKYVFGASYTREDVFYLGGSFRLKNQAGWNGNPDDNKGRHESGQFIGDFRYLGMKALTAIAAFNFDKLEDFSNIGTMVFSQTLGYKVNDEINLGLNAVQFLYQADNTDPAFLFNIWGSYTIGDIVPRVDIVYFMGGNSNLGSGEWHRKGFTAASTGDKSDNSVISVRPSVRINVDNRTFFEIGNMFNFDARPAGDIITNAFYVDFRWNF
jgi:hypothetical protein